MPICAIGPQEAHAPVGPNPSWLRLVELEGDRARCAPVPVSNWRKDAIPKQVRRSNFDRWDTDAEGDWLP